MLDLVRQLIQPLRDAPRGDDRAHLDAGHHERGRGDHAEEDLARSSQAPLTGPGPFMLARLRALV